MKKLLLFLGVGFSIIFIACKKENASNQNTDTIQSLPIPLTTGTWWKYQRVDSIFTPGYYQSTTLDTSIETITVIGKGPFTEVNFNINRSESFLLEVRNITKNRLDTIHAFYDSSSFYIVPHKDTFFLFNNIPLIEGASKNAYNYYPRLGFSQVNKNMTVSLFNKTYDNCIFYFDSLDQFAGNRGIGHELKTYLKPCLGFVDWKYKEFGYYDGPLVTRTYRRRLMDYYIAP